MRKSVGAHLILRVVNTLLEMEQAGVPSSQNFEAGILLSVKHTHQYLHGEVPDAPLLGAGSVRPDFEALKVRQQVSDSDPATCVAQENGVVGGLPVYLLMETINILHHRLINVVSE